MNLSSIKHAASCSYAYTLLALLSAPYLLRAEGAVDNPSPVTGGSGILRNPINANNIQDLLGLIMNVITILVLPFAIFFLVRTGFFFATAGGNEDKISRAKTDFLYVVIGLAIILGAQLIGAILQNTLNSLR
ncbi:hypothetical protein K8Q93_02275 [Candidatus Parcubacteria bacterium]|nr:hypothetical protein [Candidatus Parcubacteria bacterium]